MKSLRNPVARDFSRRELGPSPFPLLERRIERRADEGSAGSPLLEVLGLRPGLLDRDAPLPSDEHVEAVLGFGESADH